MFPPATNPLTPTSDLRGMPTSPPSYVVDRSSEKRWSYRVDSNHQLTRYIGLLYQFELR